MIHQKLKVADIQVEDVADTETMKNGLQICSPKKSFIVLFSSPEEKQEWRNDFDGALQREKSKRDTFRVHAKTVSEADFRKSTIAPVWQPDVEAPRCTLCTKSFTVVNRRVDLCC